MSNQLLQRAEQLFAGSALAALAITPLTAHADVITAQDFNVESSGIYFYNSSGYFADWRGLPDGSTTAEVNPDGSAKLYGTATATPTQFFDHNCSTEYGCTWYQDRGIAMVFRGTLNAPAQAGDQISLNYDFNIDIPDVGGYWQLFSSLGSSNFSNSNFIYSNSQAYGSLDEGSHHLTGNFLGSPLQEWDIYPDSPVIYWQVALTALASAPYSDSFYSDTYGGWVTPYRGLSLTVPNHSLDIALFNSSNAQDPTSTPEPSMLGLALAGLGLLFALRRA